MSAYTKKGIVGEVNDGRRPHCLHEAVCPNTPTCASFGRHHRILPPLHHLSSAVEQLISIDNASMERAGSFNVMSLFSRGASPPPDANSPSPPQPNSQYQTQSQQHPPSQSYREQQPSASPPKALDSLFRNINQQQPSHSSESASQVGGNNPFRSQQPQQNNSAPTTPVSSTTVASAQSSAPATVQPADRQSALLSLLGSVTSTGSASANNNNSNQQQPPVPAHPPSPPIVDQRGRAMPPGSEAQGKILLEQLMSG